MKKAPRNEAARLRRSLQLIKRAHVKPKPLPAEDVARYANRAPAQRSIWREKGGKIVFHRIGERGTDLPLPPRAYDIRRAHRAAEIDQHKVERALRAPYISRKGVTARLKDSAAAMQSVAKLATKHADRGRGLAVYISARVGLSASQVRRLLAKIKRARPKTGNMKRIKVRA